jgi:alanine racemase
VTFTHEEIAERGHPVWAEVDLAALRHNIETLRAIARPAELMAVVKGYAYGHGNPVCAQVALEAGATRLGVARVAEAFHLRESGVTAPIHVFTEPPPEAAKTVVKHGLTATVYTQAFADALGLAATQAGTSVSVHVKLDTGMHRVGLSPDDALDAISRMRDVEGITIEGAWTHLAVADVPDHPFTRKQLDLFDDLVGKIEASGTPLAFKHVANSAATLSLPEARYDIVRCGIACYGLWPGDRLVRAADLRPVLSLKARINMVKSVPAGEGLSYGLSYELDRPGRVVTVPAGYADGYDRRLSGKGDVLISGKRFRVSGTVCMDQFMVDVGGTEVEAGTVVTLLGTDGSEQVTAEELAGHVGTINYEVTARIPSRVPRIYLEAK